MSRGDGQLKVTVTPADDQPGFLNVQMQWPTKKGEEPNVALMTIGTEDAGILITELFPWVRKSRRH